MFALVDRVPAVAGDEGLEPSAEVVGDLEFRDVWFHYQNRDKASRQQTLAPSCLTLAYRTATRDCVWTEACLEPLPDESLLSSRTMLPCCQRAAKRFAQAALVLCVR